jgi:hypothetical protein
MPRDGAIIFGDLYGRLDILRVSCGQCGLPAHVLILAPHRLRRFVSEPPITQP